MDCVQPCPSYFRTLIFQSSHNCINDIQKCWDYLCSPNTFQGSFWNFSKVEFVNPKNPSDLFSEGAYTNHHGPLLSANGIISKIEKPFFRKMDYFYGSYIGTFRLFRPVELIFTFKEDEKARKILEREQNKKLKIYEKNRPIREGCLRKLCETDI